MAAPQEKIYQVFISSTYKNLIEERKGAIEAILNSGCVPIGMEIFPASDEDPLAYIREVIDYCDYYILIISERYGTIRGETGKSYTEEEFDYAESAGKTILVFVDKKVEDITLDEIKKDPEKQKLKSFIDRVSEGRNRRTWSTPGDLKYEVSSALNYQRKKGGAVGWIKADQVNSNELMSKYISLIDENNKLKEENGVLKKQSVNYNFIDMIMNDDLTIIEMIIVRRILEKDCATVSTSDFFNNDGESIFQTDYFHIDIRTAMKQLVRMGAGDASAYYLGEVQSFTLKDMLFRLIRKSSDVREKLGLRSFNQTLTINYNEDLESKSFRDIG